MAQRSNEALPTRAPGDCPCSRDRSVAAGAPLRALGIARNGQRRWIHTRSCPVRAGRNRGQVTQESPSSTQESSSRDWISTTEYVGSIPLLLNRPAGLSDHRLSLEARRRACRRHVNWVLSPRNRRPPTTAPSTVTPSLPAPARRHEAGRDRKPQSARERHRRTHGPRHRTAGTGSPTLTSPNYSE